MQEPFGGVRNTSSGGQCTNCGATWVTHRGSSRIWVAPLGIFFVFLGFAVLIDRILAETSVQPTLITGLGAAYAIFGGLTLVLGCQIRARVATPSHCPRCHTVV